MYLTEQNNNKPPQERISVEDLAKILNISRATYYRYLEFAKTSVIEMSAKKVWKKII